MHPEMRFEGLETIEDHLLHFIEHEHASYLVLYERTHWTREDTLGRFDLDEEDARALLGTSGLASAVYADDEDEDEDDELGTELITQAALTWLRSTALQNMAGQALGRFRVRIYGPKGHRTLKSASFSCHAPQAPEPMAVPALPGAGPQGWTGPVPQFLHPQPAQGEAGATLGDHYAQWAAVVLGSFQQLGQVSTATIGQLQHMHHAMMAQFQTVYEGMVDKLHAQSQDQREQVDQLVSAVLHHRVRAVELREQHTQAQRSEEQTTVLAREGLVRVSTSYRVQTMENQAAAA